MSNVLSTPKQQQVIALARLGWSLRRIEAETGVRRETAGKYARDAGVAVRSPGRWGHDPPKPAIEVITDPPKVAMEVITDSPPSRSPSASACEPYRELIEQGLSAGRNAMAIWQDLVSDHGFDAQYASVGRFVRKLRRDHGGEAKVTIVTAPGEEGQVDYGEGPMVRHPETGKYRRTRLFALTLGFSRKTVWLLTFLSSSRIWCELHELAFRRLGGVPRVMVLDNLKEGVLKADVFDPELNPLYRDMLAHYGVVALPCRVRHPDRKGKVESAVGHAQRTPLKGQRFENLDDAQAYLDRWTERWADTRIHGTTKRQVAAMFDEEKPALVPLPAEPFRYYEHGRRKVHLDGCVEVQGAYYAAPPGMIGLEVTAQWNGLHVRILDVKTGQLLREHARGPKGARRFHPRDYPKRTPPTTERLLERARNAGDSIGKLCQHIHAHDGEYGIRRIQGVLSLAKKHGVSVADDACAVALDVDMPSYQFVKRYLERTQLRLGIKQVDPLIRELTRYRDLINDRTQGDTP